MKRLLVLVTLLLLIASPVGHAQVISQVSPNIASATLTTNVCAGASISSTGCIGVNMGGYTRIGVNISGTWSGTISFQISGDNGVTWVAANLFPASGAQTAVTSVTTNGLWTTENQPLVGTKFRANFTTATSGSAVVTVISTM